jgi:glyoxylase-like metal-dependent hydrolase (beta-lactamase superfamily II)
MREIDLLHLGREKVICCFEVDGIIVDPGPQSTEATLLEALDGERPRALLLTHIHFDHAGVSGALVRRWPDLPVYVHERGAPHIIDPSKLVASAGRLYGGDEGLRRIWGEVIPVPEGNVRVLSGGERDIEGAYRVEYTPGHASHHVCYLHEPTGTAFVGDMGGVRLPPHDFTIAPTPPPDIDVAAWDRSLDTIAAWEPERLALTHFGTASDAQAQLDRCRTALHEEAQLVAEHDQDGLVAAVEARVRAELGDDAESFLQAIPPHHIFLGLDRWRKKLSDAPAPPRSA